MIVYIYYMSLTLAPGKLAFFKNFIILISFFSDSLSGLFY